MPWRDMEAAWCGGREQAVETAWHGCEFLLLYLHKLPKVSDLSLLISKMEIKIPKLQGLGRNEIWCCMFAFLFQPFTPPTFSYWVPDEGQAVDYA